MTSLVLLVTPKFNLVRGEQGEPEYSKPCIYSTKCVFYVCFQVFLMSELMIEQENFLSLNWNPHSLLQINPNPTPLPSTQLTLVYNTYVYPLREEEKDSRMAGFKTGCILQRSTFNRSTGGLLLYDWSNTKSRLDPGSFLLQGAL